MFFTATSGEFAFNKDEPCKALSVYGTPFVKYIGDAQANHEPCVCHVTSSTANSTLTLTVNQTNQLDTFDGQFSS